ncbi:MAG: hypothetical protein D8M52_07120 [Chlorobi bacterium]|nr:hypothetical protein [Chlorobiota bacterium]
MRKVLIILLTVLLIPGNGLPEFEHVAAVIQHYHHHIQVHGEHNLPFLQFLVDHYGSKSHKDAEHDQLPFHGCSHCQAAPIVYIAHLQSTNTEPPVNIVRTMLPENQKGTSHRSDSVFQPPRA